MTTMSDNDTYLVLVEGLSAEEKMEVLQESLSPDYLEALKLEAIEINDHELCKLISTVESSYLERFQVAFFYPETKDNNAKVVKFEKNGEMFYHVDYSINGIAEGQQVMVFRKGKKEWHSDHPSFNKDLFASIGRAITRYENGRLNKRAIQ